MQKAIVMSEKKDDLEIIKAAFEASSDIVFKWDLITDSIQWVGDISGLVKSKSPVVMPSGTALRGRINPQDLPDRLSAIADHFATQEEAIDIDYRLRCADGSFSWVHERGRASFSPSGQPLSYLGVLRQITKRKRYESKLLQAANYDDLTGQLNRPRLKEVLQKTIAYTQRYKSKGAYFAIGIDKIGLINDGFGHDAADAVIIGVGQRIKRAIRASDTIGRVGGDTFGVVLDNCNTDEMARIATKFMSLFRDRPIQTPAGPIHITVSIGGVAFPEMANTPSEAMTRADSALQESKEKGRDCFIQYLMDDEQRSQQRKHIEIGEQIKNALKHNNLFFAFQPIVKSNTHEPFFYECLLRMKDIEGNLVPAGLFIPTVEKLGLNRLVDLRTLDLCIQELEKYTKIDLALNISGHTCSDQTWLSELTMKVKDRPDLAKRLIIEITETAAIKDLDETMKFVEKVRELGCRIALDDFGAGYTSFMHLKSLAVDIVKIDGTFVRGLCDEDENESLVFVQTLVGLTKSFGLATVAECVENEEQAEILRKEGVQLLQGWHFGKPDVHPAWREEKANLVELHPNKDKSVAS